MKGKGIILVGIIGMGCLFGMPQAQASVLEDVMDAEGKIVSMYQQDESVVGSVKRHVDRHIKKGMRKVTDRVQNNAKR